MTTTATTCGDCGGTMEAGYCTTWVAESKRFCGSCDRPVGRGRDGRAGLAEGFCPNCGARFSFAPGELAAKLALGLAAEAAGDLVAAARYLQAGLDCVAAARSAVGGRLLGCDFTERALRFGLERSYRVQARKAPDPRRRIELVDLANNVRPGTWS